MPTHRHLPAGLQGKTRPTLFLGPVLLIALLGVHPSADVTLVQAVKTGNVQTVRAMVKAKADTNSAEPDGTTALHWAVQRSEERRVGKKWRSRRSPEQ